MPEPTSHEPVVSPNPQPTAAPTAGKVTSWEETDVAKKYGNDPAKASAAWIELQNSAAAQKRENDALKQEVQNIKAGLSQLGGAPNATKPTSVTQALAQDLAIDASTLQGAVAETLIALLGPGAEAQKAVTEYAKETEGFADRKADVESFRDQNPEIAARFTRMESADPKAAWEWLDAKFISQPTRPGEEAPEIAVQRAHAGDPGGRGAAVRGGRMVDPSANVNELAEKYTKGETQKEEYRSAALDLTSGKQEFLRQLAQMTGTPQG